MKYPKSLNKPNSEEEFIFHATDAKGHHTTLHVAVPPEMDQMINEILARPHFKYRTKADIVRDALYHRLCWLCDNANLGYGEMLKRIKTISQLLEEEESRINYQHQMEKLAEVIAGIQDSPERQAEIVNAIADEIREMPEGYWRERYLNYLKVRFGSLLKPWDMGDRKEK